MLLAVVMLFWQKPSPNHPLLEFEPDVLELMQWKKEYESSKYEACPTDANPMCQRCTVLI